MNTELKNLLTKRDAFVSTCSLAAIRMFGLESLDWDALVIRDALEQELAIKKIPQRLFDKVNCGYSLMATNGYPTHLEIFVPCNAVMANQQIEEGTMGLDDPYTLAWGVWEYLRLTGESHEEVQFSDDVRIYSGEVLYQAGMTDPLPWLKWVQFDPVKEERLHTLLTDPEFYNARQIALKDNLGKMINKRNQALTDELKEMDRLLPAPNN